jgi:predicted permease
LDTTKLPQKGPALLDLYGAILERTKTLPAVESAALEAFTPLSGGQWDNYVTFPGSAAIPEEQRDPRINPVSPGLLRTMRIPLLSGRDFTDFDTGQSQKVAIISENAARRWFPSGALGADLVLRNNNIDFSLRVVGIAGDIKFNSLRDEMPPTMYLPYTQWNQTGSVVMRTKAPVRQTLAIFRDVLRQVAPGTPIRTIKTMEEVADESLSTERLTAYLSMFFATLALLLTAVGLYGILAYTVARRTSEIGIRMALGAPRVSVIWLVIREALGSTAVGAGVGMAVVAAASKLIASLLYGVHPHDPATMILAVAVLGLVCLIAAWIPARRACRLDPMAALREE